MSEDLRGLRTGSVPPPSLRSAVDLLQYAPMDPAELPLWFEALTDAQFQTVWPPALYEARALEWSIANLMLVVDAVRWRYQRVGVVADVVPACPAITKSMAPPKPKTSPQPGREPVPVPIARTKSHKPVRAPSAPPPAMESPELEAWKVRRRRKRRRTAELLLDLEREHVQTRQPVKFGSRGVLTKSEYICLCGAITKDPLWRRVSPGTYEFELGPEKLRAGLEELGLLKREAAA